MLPHPCRIPAANQIDTVGCRRQKLGVEPMMQLRVTISKGDGTAVSMINRRQIFYIVKLTRPPKKSVINLLLPLINENYGIHRLKLVKACCF